MDKSTQQSIGRSLTLAAHLPNPKQALAVIYTHYWPELYKEPKHTESEGLPVVQPSTKVTPRVYLGVVYKALSAPFDPLTEAKEHAQVLAQAHTQEPPQQSAHASTRNRSSRVQPTTWRL